MNYEAKVADLGGVPEVIVEDIELDTQRSRRRRILIAVPPAGSGAVRVAGDLVWVTAHDTHTVWVLK